jgi:putative membrane-bound dehydrogenase-like protein
MFSDCRSFLRMLACLGFLTLLFGKEFARCQDVPAAARTTLSAGAAAVDISPTSFPVIRNGGFLEAQDHRLADPLFARAIVLESGGVILAIVIVDSCMIPTDVCDNIKAIASKQTGIPRDHMLIAATHTHSAPSVMDYCLGSRADPAYTAYLPQKVADAIALANERRVPARIAWGQIDAAEFTHCRRWITRPDKLLVDPFGDHSVRAMMHPGFQNPEFIAPSGPCDPWLSVISLETVSGEPLALLANFSMHYFGGHDGISSDYFGLFAKKCEERIAHDSKTFVAAMSQGTSGDLWWGDYRRPALGNYTMETFTEGLVDKVVMALEGIPYETEVPLAIRERRLQIARRVPSAERIAWADRQMQIMGSNRPGNLQDVYAEQAKYLASHPNAEVVLQTIRIGKILMAALPNEVFALSGLKLKAQSPFRATMNLELANGAEGYIPPIEQHALGGYTTWPARTAGLAVEAEKQIVDALVDMFEDVSGEHRRTYVEPLNPYARAILESRPIAYWRCGEQEGDELRDASPHAKTAQITGLRAYHLPGIPVPETMAEHANRAIYLAGGTLSVEATQLAANYTVELWCWNGLDPTIRPTTGILFQAPETTLAITGTESDSPGHLAVGKQIGKTPLPARHWNHVALVRNESTIQVFINGNLEPDLVVHDVPAPTNGKVAIRLGGDSRAESGWEGLLDEIAIYDRALSAEEVAAHVREAGFLVSTVGLGVQPQSPPLSVREALEGIHVPPGFRVEVVATEPQVQDPVALDWGPDGALWVAEMADYPLGMDGKGKPGGRVRRLEDRDADGTYETSTIFQDGLSFPNGVLAWEDGVLITAAPEILYARDTNADGKADLCTPLYRGFVDGNQQLRVNGLRWGLDNWIHCASGAHHSGFGATNTVRSILLDSTVALGSRDFRIEPRTGLLEPESGPSQFGRVRDEWGEWFGVQNSLPLWHYVLDERYSRRNPFFAPPDPRKLLTPMQPRVYPAKVPEKRYHGFDHVNHYTSACGPSLYGDDLLFPREGGVQHAFTCEPFHNLVQHHRLRAEGTSFTLERPEEGTPYDFFASEDRWCRPVMSRMGPDGALWVVDMYRYMIEHPEFLPAEGQAELEPFYRHGDGLGRIYRIVPTANPKRHVPRVDVLSPEPLVEALDHPNMVIRDLAHRRLLQEKAETIEPLLRSRIRNGESSLGRLHALCVLDGLGSITEPDIIAALNDAHEGVRRHAVRIAERWEHPSPSLVAKIAAMTADPSPRVLLQLANSLGSWPDHWAGNALADLLVKDPTDIYLAASVVGSLLPHYTAVSKIATRKPERFHPAVTHAIWVMALEKPRAFADYLRALLSDPRTHFECHIAEIATGLRAWDEQGILFPFDKADIDASRESASQGGSARSDMEWDWALKAFEAWSAQAEFFLGRSDISEDIRMEALELIGRFPARHGSDGPLLRAHLGPENSPSMERVAIRRLLAADDSLWTDNVLAAWPSYSAETRDFTLELVMRRESDLQSLLRHLASGTIKFTELTPVRREQLLQHPDLAIRQQMHSLVAQRPNADRQAVLQQYQSALKLEGDATRGDVLFQKHCANCHVAQGEQPTSLGPDLRSLTDRQAAGLLVSILDPSQSVEPKYLGYHVTLDTGEVLFGVVTQESSHGFQLRLPDGQERSVLRSQIETLQGSKRSFMPDGMESVLNPQEVADVMRFIQGLGGTIP